jgi:hypothetical protein
LKSEHVVHAAFGETSGFIVLKKGYEAYAGLFHCISAIQLTDVAIKHVE